MKQTAKILIVCLSFFLFESLQAQEVKAVLTHEDIGHFIETFKPMTREMEALGNEFEEDEDEIEYEDEDPMESFNNMRAEMKKIMSEEEALTILEKYDWDENYLDTYIAISIGYYYNKMSSELEKMDESEKEMSKPMMDLFLEQFRLMVNEKDREMLLDHMVELDAVFNE